MLQTIVANANAHAEGVRSAAASEAVANKDTSKEAKPKTTLMGKTILLSKTLGTFLSHHTCTLFRVESYFSIAIF